MGPPGTCLEASQLSVTGPYIPFGKPKSNYSMVILNAILNRPRVAGAVLQTPL